MVKPIPPDDVKETWPQPNFIDPETRDHVSFMGITITLTLITLIVVSLRTYVRFFNLRAPGWDDYFIFISALSAVALCITVNLGFNFGWDRHYWDQKPEWFEVSELIQWIVQVNFIIIMTFVKLSALCTYLRASQKTRYRRFVWVTLVVVALWGISFLFATIFECTPVQNYWTSVDGKGCSNEDARLLIATIVNILTDIVVVLMPIPIIMKLKRPMREKLTLGFLMCLGSVAIVASIVRTVVMSQSLLTLRYDMTWNAYVVWIWLILECDLAIICISVPVLRVLFRRWFPKREEKTIINKTQGTRLDSPGGKNMNAIKPGPGGSFTSLIQEGKIIRTDGIEMYSRPADNLTGSGMNFGNGKPNANLSPRLDDVYDSRNGRRWGKRDPYDLDDLDNPRYARRDPLSRV